MSKAPLPIDARRRASGVRPMGVGSGVTSAGEGYRDAEAAIDYRSLASYAALSLEPATSPRFLVFDGAGDLDGRAVRSGDLAILPSHRSGTLRAASRGLRCFIVAVETPTEVGYSVQVLPRVPLAPFELEGIVVPSGTPFAFGDQFNFAEVLVPPSVATAEHDLGVNERYLVLGGPATMFLDGEAHPVRAGDVVHIPSGVAQYIQNESDEPLRFYCLCTPPFTLPTYAAGRVRASRPAGFDLAAWWSTVKNVYEA